MNTSFPFDQNNYSLLENDIQFISVKGLFDFIKNPHYLSRIENPHLKIDEKSVCMHLKPTNNLME